VRAALGYKPNTISTLWLAFQYHSILNPSTDKFFDEKRVDQQLDLRFSKAVGFRTRLEERFRDNAPGTSIRFRQRLIYSFINFNTLKITPFISDEVFLNFDQTKWTNGKAFDQNRLTVGFNKKITKDYSFTMGYLYLYSESRTTNAMIHAVNFSVSFS